MTSIHLWWTNFYHSLPFTLYPPYDLHTPLVDQFLPFTFWKPSPGHMVDKRSFYPPYDLHTLYLWWTNTLKKPSPVISTIWLPFPSIIFICQMAIDITFLAGLSWWFKSNPLLQWSTECVFPSFKKSMSPNQCGAKMYIQHTSWVSWWWEIKPWREHSLLVKTSFASLKIVNTIKIGHSKEPLGR